jgi:hypothetical protein
MPRSIERSSASALSRRDLFLAAFITNIAESEFSTHTQAAIMFNPDTAPASTYMPSLGTAARALKVAPIIAPVHGDAEIETAITAPLGSEIAGALKIVAAFAPAPGA